MQGKVSKGSEHETSPWWSDAIELSSDLGSGKERQDDQECKEEGGGKEGQEGEKAVGQNKGTSSAMSMYVFQRQLRDC